MKRMRLFKIRQSRRGTVLLMALGVLGILALVGVSYVTIVRLDRASALAVARESSYDQQVDAVIAHMQDLMAADLFGNKIVTNGVPLKDSANRNIWPRMFENGESRTFPSVEPSTFNRADRPYQDPPFGDCALLPARETALPDHAWLASTEPLWDPNNPEATAIWLQITNLGGAYVYRINNPRIPSDDRWVRGDGRFVDLGEWFLQATANYANAGINLTDWSATGIPDDTSNPNRRLGATARLMFQDPILPGTGVEELVFDRQMSRMSEDPLWGNQIFEPQDPGDFVEGTPAPERLNPQDERQWADTDGDLRPDARWQQLDSLGNLFGLTWVVAARIIDASSLVNVNSAIEFGDLATLGIPTKMGNGETPADVDLYRLLDETRLLTPPTGVTGYDLAQVSQLPTAYSNHLSQGIGIDEILQEANRLDSAIPTLALPWGTTQRLDRVQRRALWEYFGASPTRSPLSAGAGYPARDLIDLMAFAGTNYPNIVSKAEQRFDGPETGRFLPGTGSLQEIGPLRSKDSGAASRRLDSDGDGAIRGYPTAQQIRDSRRRFLTTVSGHGDFSPVPVLNPAREFDGKFYNQKVRLSELKNATITPPVTAAAKRAFESFVWALAPLGPDQPPAAGVTTFGIGAPLAAFHYGGIDGAQLGERFFPATTGQGADFAVMTAAALTANLRDAMDNDSEPSLIRVHNDPILAPPATPPTTANWAFSTRLSQGDIPTGNLDAALFPAGRGMLTVGVERQPFLREVTTIAVYSSSTADNAAIVENNVVGDHPEDELGSAIAIELANPWSTIVRTAGYSIILPESKNNVGSAPLVISLPDVEIGPGKTHIFYWVYEGTASVGLSWGDGGRGPILDNIKAKAPFSGGADTTEITGLTLATGYRVLFRDQIAADDYIPVLLTRNVGGEMVIVDRMSPADDGEKFPQGYVTGTGFALTLELSDNVSGGFVQQYFADLEYLMNNPGPDPRIAAGQMVGRLMVTSSLTRPGAQPPSGGFPAYVLEFPSVPGESFTGRNYVHKRREAHAWLVPYTGNASDINAVFSSRTTPGDIVDPSSLPPGHQFTFPTDHANLGQGTKRCDTNDNPHTLDPATLSGFSLYVPVTATTPAPASIELRSELNALSELHMLPAFATTYSGTDTPTVFPGDDLTRWSTLGEKLARSATRDFTFGSAVKNPYVGVLDPTRFILTGDSAAPGDLALVNNLPHTMAVPLATRVFECFEPLDPPARLAQGRININTAPQTVLEMLPLVAPAFDIGGPAPAGLGAGTDRAREIVNYRNGIELDPVDFPAPVTPFEITALNGLRQGAPPAPGFASIGELAILDEWEDPASANAGNPVSDADQFLALAAPIAGGAPNDIHPLQLESRINDLADRGSLTNLNPVDDPEERLAIFRAVSNIVTTRSDVFIAWFILRGYDPDLVERIPVTGTGSTALRAMDPSAQPDIPRFEPSYESRWLVVFDRSNIRRPTDRPKVLLKVELPRATP